MLTITIGAEESYDEATQEFVMTGGTPVQLEHSLLSVSKWEALYEKPFLGQGQKSDDETTDYIRMMALDANLPPELFADLSAENIRDVSTYIDAKMTATWFSDTAGPTSRAQETITSELIYYWLIALNIPFECQSWHLNRLLTLVKVCNQKNQPPKKMSRQSIAERNRSLNAQRKAQLNTNG